MSILDLRTLSYYTGTAGSLIMTLVLGKNSWRNYIYGFWISISGCNQEEDGIFSQNIHKKQKKLEQ